MEIFKNFFKILLKLTVVLVMLVLLFFGVVWSVLKFPKIQNFLVSKATTFVSNKTHTIVALGRIDIGFPKYIILENLYLNDTKNDTLIFLEKLSIDVNMLALIKRKISVSNLSITGVNANIYNTEKGGKFNFQFLIDAFSKPDTTVVSQKADSTKKPWEIGLDELTIINTKARFLDSVGGTFVNARIGDLTIEVDELNLLEKMVAIDAIKIENTSFNFFKTKTTSDTSTADGQAPWHTIGLNNLLLKKVSVNYADSTSSICFQSNIKNFELNEVNLNLLSQQIVCEKLALMGSESKFSMREKQKAVAKIPSKVASNKGWKILAQQLKMAENNFEMNADTKAVQHLGIDWKHLRLKNIGANIHTVKYTTDTVEATLEHLQFQDQSGFGLKKMYGKLHLYNKEAAVEDFLIETNFSSIAKDIHITFDSLGNIAQSLAVNAKLSNTKIAIKDLLLLQPSLSSVDIIHQNRNRTFLVEVEAKGTLKKMIARKILLQTESKQTRVFATAKIGNLNQPKKIYWDAIIHEVSTKNAEVTKLLPATMLPSAIALPTSIAIKGRCAGSNSAIDADIVMQTSEGNVKADVVIKKLQTKNPQYTAQLSTQQLNMGKILRQEKMLGKLTMTGHIEGNGFEMENAFATIQTKISVLDFNQYQYKNIAVDADIKGGNLVAQLAIKDSNLVCVLNASYVALKGKEQLVAKFDLKGADLNALKLTDQHIRLSATTDVDLKGITMPTLNGNLSVKNLMVVKDKKTYTVDSLVFVSVNANERSSMKLNTSLLSAQFDGNIDIASVAAAVSQHVSRYFNIDNSIVAMPKKVQDFEFEIMVNDSPLLYDLLLPKLKSYTPAPIKGGFDSKISKLWLKTTIPQINYDGLDIKRLEVNVNSDSSSLSYLLGFQALSVSDYRLAKTQIDGTVQQNIVNTNWSILDNKKVERLKMATQIKHWKNNLYRIKIMDEGLILAGERWASQPENYIEIGGKTILINQLKLTKGAEFLSAQSAENGNQLNIQLNKFHLKNLSQIIEQHDSLVRGVVDGRVVLKNLNAQSAFIADVKLNNLSYKKSYVGDLALKANNLSAGKYTLAAHLGGKGNDVTVAGYMQNTADGQLLKLNADINNLQLSAIEPFTAGQVTRATGSIKGNATITGTTKNPLINGELKFVEAMMNVTYLNSRLLLKNESIKFDPNGVYFSNFTLRDSLANTAVIDGNVRMKAFSNFKFALSLTTDNFLALNTTAVNNKLYFGRIILDSKIKISGTPDLPIIKANIDLAKGSHFTFAVPESRLSIDKGDGIVEFLVDTSKINPIMVRQVPDSVVSDYKGLDISANIHIDKFSTLKILVDPVAGDSLVAKGDANLNFTLDPSGKTSLTGSYALTDGSYKVSLQEVIKKEFKIISGSTISWAGDPLDATIDITAQYVTRTTAADLMGGRSGADSSTLSIPIDFYVMLSMKGQLLKPQLSFKIDIPLASRSIGGGAIYAKLSELNNSESELNKQVFSLLLLNRFVPNNTVSSGGGGASSIARSSLSKILSDELNKLSAQHVKGVELNFDLQSFNQNTNGRQQGNTQLKVGVKKQLLDERLSIQVGSNVNLEGSGNKQSNLSNLTGDVVLEYKLSEDGRYRLKGFRQNQYDGIANGVITQTGVGIMYRRDFETTKELFMPPKKPKIKKERKSKKNDEVK